MRLHRLLQLTPAKTLKTDDLISLPKSFYFLLLFSFWLRVGAFQNQNFIWYKIQFLILSLYFRSNQ